MAAIFANVATIASAFVPWRVCARSAVVAATDAGLLPAMRSSTVHGAPHVSAETTASPQPYARGLSRTATKYRNTTTATCRPAGLVATLPRSATNMIAPAGSSGRSVAIPLVKIPFTGNLEIVAVGRTGGQLICRARVLDSGRDGHGRGRRSDKRWRDGSPCATSLGHRLVTNADVVDGNHVPRITSRQPLLCAGGAGSAPSSPHESRRSPTENRKVGGSTPPLATNLDTPESA